MYIVEIFLKKRRFSSIYKTAWPLLSAHIAYPPATEDEPGQRLVFFGALTYAAVYQSSLAAGMSTSAAHYMARVFVHKFRFEEWINEAIIAIFAPSDDEAQAYASGFLSRVGSMIEMACAGGEGTAPEGIEPAMVKLSEFYRKVTFTPR